MLLIAFFLIVFSGLGLPFCLCLPRSTNDRFAPAPVFGLALFAIGATLGFRTGYFSQISILLGTAGTGILIGAFIKMKERREVASFMLAGLCVSIIGLLPFWIGGHQFTIFQGNPYDQFNYISMSSAFASHDYADISTSGAGSDFAFLRLAKTMLNDRPAVAVILATVRPFLYSTTAEAAYPYLILLQSMSFYTIFFTSRQVFNSSRAISFFVALAFSIGFYPQYVLDINAWSSLSALSLGLLAGTLLILICSGMAGVLCAIPFSLASAGILYLYPESASACAIPFCVIFVGSFLKLPAALRPNVMMQLGLSAVLVLAVCAAYPETTILFLMKQMGSTATIPQWEWFLGYNSFYLQGHIRPSTVADYFSVPIDIVMGILGLYYLAPRNSFVYLIGALEYGFVALLIISILRASKSTSQKIFVSACAASIGLPISLWIAGQYWSSAKAVSMISPFLFMALASPILLKRERLYSIAEISTLLLIIAHLSFGIQRVAAATDDRGERSGKGYPKVAGLKDRFNFDIERWRQELRDCQSAIIAVRNPLVERLTETIINDLGISASITVPRKSNYIDGEILPPAKIDGSYRCYLSDSEVPAAKPYKTIDLRLDQTHPFENGREFVDLLRQGTGTGLHNLESYDDSSLVWTNGNAEWHFASMPKGMKLNLEFWSGIVNPTTEVTIVANGVTISQTPIWQGMKSFSLPGGEATSLAIRTPSFRAPPDTRTLGVPIKSATISK